MIAGQNDLVMVYLLSLETLSVRKGGAASLSFFGTVSITEWR
jgi:hypothetical protein